MLFLEQPIKVHPFTHYVLNDKKPDGLHFLFTLIINFVISFPSHHVHINTKELLNKLLLQVTLDSCVVFIQKTITMDVLIMRLVHNTSDVRACVEHIFGKFLPNKAKNTKDIYYNAKVLRTVLCK